MVTGYGDLDTTVSALDAGAVKVLFKPLRPGELREVVDAVFADRRKRVAGAQQAKPDKSGLIGSDRHILEVYERIAKLAKSNVSVLIRGETGTGKELVARSLHTYSARASEPFIAVNCTALASTLLESELFGHVRGSFTGAESARKGRLVAAGKGTLFLDEIGDTTPEFQAKLLRVLQEREFYAVGADVPQRVNAHIIAATHRDLEKLVAGSAFRADLFYRLRVVEIWIPPLRERMTDVPLLGEHFIGRAAAAEHLSSAPVLGPDALEALLAHNWPGNVRELENCMSRAVALARGGVIHAADLGLEPGEESAAWVGRSLTDVERAHIERVLRYTRGNKSRAATVLCVSRTRLDRLLTHFGIAYKD